MPAPGVCLNILLERNLKDGQGSPGNPERFLDQDFQQLKQFCLKERLRFRDNLFPPEMKSIGFGPLEREELWKVVWKRPHVREHLQTQTQLLTDLIIAETFMMLIMVVLHTVNAKVLVMHIHGDFKGVVQFADNLSKMSMSFFLQSKRN